MDKLQRLDDRLEAGLQGHLSAWGKLPPDEIVMLSKEITAVRDAYDYLTRPHTFESEEIDYLLSLPDPLQTVADKWKERMVDMSDFCFALDEVFKEAKSQQRETGREKPSVLNKIKDKAPHPTQVKPHASGKGGMRSEERRVGKEC